MAKKAHSVAPVPHHARLVIPVLGATGGSGRSTVAGLLACSLAPMASTAILDTTPRLPSPWPTWPSEQGLGLVAVPPDTPVTRRQVLTAASRCAGPEGRHWQVLTDHQAWSGTPLPLPIDPAAWYQLAAVGGWQAIVADTAPLIGHELLAARTEGTVAPTTTWCALPYSVPVLCVAATGPGVRALQVALKVALAEQLPLQRTVVALVAIGEGRLPAAVRAAATMLQSQVSAVIDVPFEPHIRAHGMGEAHRLRGRVLAAGSDLAAAVFASAHRTWGEPLPPAPVPAPAPSARSATAPGVPV